MNYSEEFIKLIEQVSGILGRLIDKEKYEVVDRGVPHKPQILSNGMMGIYTFWYNGSFLKIGKVGPKSNARFLCDVSRGWFTVVSNYERKI